MEAVLYIHIDPSQVELKEIYRKHIEKHNDKMENDSHPDSGFDLFVPETEIIPPGAHNVTFIDFQIKAEMTVEDEMNIADNPTGFYIFVRSSVSKTPLMLANHTGVIDSGYRGNIKGAIRNLHPSENYVIDKHTRLLQICHPSLCKIRVVLRDSISETLRGEGGFGSTGK
jgi:dUTP pyrophosphatase